MGSALWQWMKKNEDATDHYCTRLLKDQKKRILDQVFARLQGPDASSMEFKEIVEAYNKLEKAYNNEARGDRNIRAVVFQRLHPVRIDTFGRDGDACFIYLIYFYLLIFILRG